MKYLSVTAQESVGVECSGDTARYAVVAQQGGQRQLIAVAEEAVATVKPLYTLFPEELHRQLDDALVVSALPAGDVLIRSLRLPLTKERDIQSVLQYEVEPLLPYSVEEALLAQITLDSDNDGSALTVLATRRECLAAHLETAGAMLLEPEEVSCVPVALANFVACCVDASKPVLCVHTNNEETAIVVVEDAQLVASYTLSLGIDDFIKAVAKDTQQEESDAQLEVTEKINFSRLNSKSYPHLSKVLDRYTQELLRTLYAINKSRRGKQNEEWTGLLLTGEAAHLRGMEKRLAARTKMTAVKPTGDLTAAHATDELQRFAVAIGLAMGALADRTNKVNFRQQEFAYPRPWRRLWKPLATVGGLALTLVLLLSVAGTMAIRKQEHQLRGRYAQLLAVTGHSVEAFESEYRSRGSKSVVPIDHIDLKQLSRTSLLERLAFLDQQQKATPDLFPLQPGVPRVSDFLAWLGRHPNVVTVDDAGERTPLLQLESLSYSMLRRPDNSRKREKYQVKVDLEFTATNPKAAREFHDALIAPNKMIDPKSDVKWNASRGKYRTSFFLKDKTYYPV